MQQEQPTSHARFRYVAPGLLISGVGMLFSAGAGAYVGFNSPGQITLLVMQAFLVYSFPHLLLGAVGFIAYYINKQKLLALFFTISATLLSGTVVADEQLTAKNAAFQSMALDRDTKIRHRIGSSLGELEACTAR